MANYPTTAFSPTTKNSGDTIAASHVNDLQAEVTAVETALLTSGLAHHLIFVDNTYDIGASGATRPRTLYLAKSLVASAADGVSDNAYVADLRNLEATAGRSFGLFLQAGSNASDYALFVRDVPGTTDLLTLSGQGNLVIAGNGSGFAIGNLAGTARIAYSPTTFSFLDATNALAAISAVQATTTAGFTMATWPTTANAANAYVADAGYLSRSTSSLRYKTDVARLNAERAKAVIASLQPITYRGVHDGPTRFAGFAAEEVAEVEPLLVTRDTEGRPDYVAYDRIPAYLVPVVQELEARVAALEAR